MASRSPKTPVKSRGKTNAQREQKQNKAQDGRGKMFDPNTDGRSSQNREPREFTSEARAAYMAKLGADTEPSRDGQLTNYGLLKKIWSGRGEIVAMVKKVPVEVKRSDLIRQLEALPREGKAVFDIKDGADVDAGLEGLRVLA